MDSSEDQRFGKYELQARIAAGGMAEIFKARFNPAPGVTKQVVIKRILPHYAANTAFINMFTNEARIAMGLSHGNIAQVFDFGEIDGDWFLAMELVDGQPLSKVLKRARALQIPVMPTPFAVLTMIETLKGLHYAHTRLDETGRPLQIVHRDVSPQNVLISFEGQVKIVDFGIAKARTAGREETEAGAVKGKYAYFAPEQARGKELDSRTDVFAAGIVLYEMLCGQLPFQGKMIEVMSKIVRGEFPPPREVNPDITPALERILLTAMAHEKSERYVNAEAFQQALSNYLYQNAPTFAPSSLGLFMSFLFEEELNQDGRPIQLPRDFLEQVSLWKRESVAPRAKTSERLEETKFARSPTREKKALSRVPSAYDDEAPVTDENSVRSGKGRDPRKLLRRVLFGAIPIGAALITMAVVLLVGHFTRFAVQLTSIPDHAVVRVDGREEGFTPITLQLDADRVHELEVTAPGMQKWVQRVSPARGEVFALTATLSPERPPEDLTREDDDPGPDFVEPPEPEEKKKEPVYVSVPMQAAWPVAEVTVDPRKHVFLVPPSKSARLRLDPKHQYKVWTEGKLSFGGYLADVYITEAVWFVEGGPAAKASETFGIVGNKPIVVKNAQALHAWVMDHATGDNTGAIKVKVQDLATKQTSTILVDSKLNAWAPDADQRFTLTNLEPMAKYELKIVEGKPPAKTLGDAGGNVRRVMFGYASSWSTFQGKPTGNGQQRIVELGKPFKFDGASYVWFGFPDDGVEDNSGTLTIEITEIPGAGGVLRDITRKLQK